MTKIRSPRESLPVINRRDALYGLAGCTIAATTLNGCVISKIYGELTDAQIDFDLTEEKYKPLTKVGGMVADEAGGWELVLIRRTMDEIIALHRVCPHAAYDMSPEKFGTWDADNDRLVCEGHKSVFRADGSFISGPAQKGIRAFPVKFDAQTNRGTVTIEVMQSMSGGQPANGGTPVDADAGTSPENLMFNIADTGFEPLGMLGGMVAVNAGSFKIVLIRSGEDTVIALDRICPHQLCDMAPEGAMNPEDVFGLGKWENNELICVCHDSRFGPDGALLKGPAETGVAAFPVDFNAETGEVRVQLTAKMPISSRGQ